jgi:biotin carboxylase
VTRLGSRRSRGPVAVVVDGYSTGSKLAARFTAAGLPCVHVSTGTPPPFYRRTYRPGDYVATYDHAGDIEGTLAALRAHEVAFVLPGAETGVPLADRLSERLSDVTNGSALSHARRSKYAMAERLRAAGLDAAQQIKTASLAEAQRWAVERDDWPVVVKPVDSAGTDGVVFCADATELAEAFERQLGRPNALGACNREMLVQEQLRGRQFFLNTISWDGVHHVSEIWRDTRKRVQGAGMVCDREDLLPRRGPEQDVVADYVVRVLDALGIRFGPGHAEVMLTERGPVLIECAARMQGTLLSEAVDRCTPSHLTVTVDAYLDPSSVARRAARPYALRSHATCVALISQHSGRIVSCDLLRRLERLPSYCGQIAMLGVGARICRTVDLFSSPGTVYLVHASEGQSSRDYRRLRELEQEGLFELAP